MKAQTFQRPFTDERGFRDVPFIADLGMTLLGIGDGWCESGLVLLPRHLQQGGVAHAGVHAAMADHTAGSAAFTLIRERQFIMTVEFKINLLRPAAGESLFCRAQVLKPGRTLTVVEAEVFALAAAEKILVSKALATMAVLTAEKT